jgi:hypothetical protein
MSTIIATDTDTKQDTARNAVTALLLSEVDPGPDRWWRVELLKNVALKPIKVSLMQGQVPGRRKLSEPIGFVRTIADPAKVREAAELVLSQVGDYLKVVGDYPMEGDRQC